MKVAVIIKRGHGAADEGTRRVEAGSTLEALRAELAGIELGKKWKAGVYISAVAFVLDDKAVITACDGSEPAPAVAHEHEEIPGLAAEGGGS